MRRFRNKIIFLYVLGSVIVVVCVVIVAVAVFPLLKG
jgi:hypothetical protein